MRSKLHIWVPVAVLLLVTLACSMPGSISVEDQIRTQIVQTEYSQPSQTPLILETMVLPSPTETIQPTVTFTPTITATITSTATRVVVPSFTPVEANGGFTACNVATFLMDITVEDGAEFSPGENFVKTWRLKNVGTCTWTTDYEIFFESGSQMGGPNDLNLTESVAPGESIDISINLVAPAAEGTYRGNWKLRDEDDDVFGLTSDGPFYVEIKVVEP